MLWSSAYLNRVGLEAEIAIAEKIPSIIDWYSLNTTKNLDTYQLPDFVRDIRAVYWKGTRLYPTGQVELVNWPPTYSQIQPDGSYKIIKGSSGKPMNYWYNSFGENVIKFFPIPNESIDGGIFEFSSFEETVFNTADWDNSVMVEFYRVPDGDKYQIPYYIRRRTIKAYVLRKAFAREGDGQNLTAAKYWQQRYVTLLARGKKIVNNVYDATVNFREPSDISECRNSDYGYQGPNVPARPSLPWNYGVTCDE